MHYATKTISEHLAISLSFLHYFSRRIRRLIDIVIGLVKTNCTFSQQKWKKIDIGLILARITIKCFRIIMFNDEV